MNKPKYKKRKIVLIVFLILIAIPIGWYYAIGPRDLTGGGLVYEQELYYMGHTYRCVGWTMGGENDVKSGRLIGVGFLTYYYKGENNSSYVIVKQPHERFIYKRSDVLKKEKEEKAPVLNGLGENSTIEYNNKVYKFFAKNEYDDKHLIYEIASYIQSGIKVKSKEVDVLKLADDYYGNFLCVRGADDADYIYTCLDMTYDDFCAECVPENITSYEIRSYGRDKFYGEDSRVIHAIQRIYTDDSAVRKTNEDFRNTGNVYFITFYYNNMPITIKNTSTLRLNSGGTERYVNYFPDDMSTELYIVKDEEIKKVLWDYLMIE